MLDADSNLLIEAQRMARANHTSGTNTDAPITSTQTATCLNPPVSTIGTRAATAPSAVTAVMSQGAVPPLVSAPTARQTPSATPVNTGGAVHGRPSTSHHQGAIPPHVAALSLPSEATNSSNPAAYGRPASFDQRGALPPHATVPLQGQQNPTASFIDSGHPGDRSPIQEAPSHSATASPTPMAFPPYGFPFQQVRCIPCLVKAPCRVTDICPVISHPVLSGL